jgi:hypothetical protein
MFPDIELNQSNMRKRHSTSAAISRTDSKALTSSGDHFERLETVFAGLSVLLACVAAIIGLLQLRRRRTARRGRLADEVYELEVESSDFKLS